MSKRFTETDKWERPWFRNLPLPYKLFWIYITDRCDIAGVWYVDFDLASFVIGEPIDQSVAIEKFQKQVKILDSSRWLIRDFISFQYGSLSPKNNLHRAVSNRYEALNLGPHEALIGPSSGAKVMVKEKVKDVSSLSLGGVGGIEIPDDLLASKTEIEDWLAYKKQRGESYKSKALPALWNKFRSIPANKRRETVDQCMANNWAGLFFKQGGSYGNHSTAGYAEAKPGKYQD